VGAIDDITLSPDGKILAFSQNSDIPGKSKITVWDTNKRKTISVLYGDYFGELAFSPDGGILGYTQFPDLPAEITLGLWDLGQGKSTIIFSAGDDYFENIRFSSDGTLLAADLDYSPYANDSIVFLDLNSPLPSIQPISAATPTPTPTPTPTVLPPEQRLLGRDMGEILKMAFSPSGDRLTIASSIGVYLYQNNALKEMWRWPHTIDRQFPLAISSDGSLVASVFVDQVPRKNLILWDVLSPDPILTIPLTSDSEFIALGFSSDNQTLLAASPKGNISFWDVKRGELIREMKGESNSLSGSVIFSPDGRYLSFVALSIVHLWDLSGDSPQRIQADIIDCHELDDYAQSGDYVQSFSPDGQNLTVACDSSYHYHSGYINRIDVHYGARIDVEPVETSIHSFAFTTDGQFAVYGLYNGTLMLVDETNDIWLPLVGHADELYPPSYDDEGEVIEYGNTVTSLVFSPDRSLLASGSKDGSVILFDLDTLTEPATNKPTCAILPAQEVHALEGSNLWLLPDVNQSMFTPVLPERALYILPGPEWAPILKGTNSYGWFWKVSYSPFGASAGWIWEGRLEECQ
jgi:WD40 repeat protein